MVVRPKPRTTATADHVRVHDHFNVHVDVHVLVDVYGFFARSGVRLDMPGRPYGPVA
jgi:hypothetical protein